MALLPQDTRIPNLPTGKMVDEKGIATDGESTFRRILITSLQNNFGSEGLVIPSQIDEVSPNDYIKQIQNNTVLNPSTGVQDYTCGFGRFLYDSTNNRILVSVDIGGGVPGFAEINITMPPLVPPV
jgi:hypothetical protein